MSACNTEVLHHELQMFSVGSIHTAEPLQLPPHSPSPVRALESVPNGTWALIGVSSAPGEPLPQFCWTERLLPTLGEHQGSPVWVQMERFHPRRFLSTGKAQKDRNANQLFTCWTFTDVRTNRFCDIHLPRSKLQCQLCWCKLGQTPKVWKSLHLHQDKQKQQCPLAKTPSPLFPCCTCGSAPQCPGTISAHWRRRRWLLHPGETSHNLSHIKILPLFLSQEDSARSQCSVPSPSLLGWADGVPCSAKLHMAAIAQGPAWLGRGRAGDTTREAFGAAAPSGDGESGRVGGSIPTLGCPDVAEPSRA